MGKWKGSICRTMQPICNCVSVASRHGREAEIEVPSKRRFRLMYAFEGASSSLMQDATSSMRKVVTGTRRSLGAFLDCLYDARKRADQNNSDSLTRKIYRKLPH